MSARRLTPQQKGRDYEAELVERYGGRTQPASGATPLYKLDCKIGELLVSAKRTKHESYRLTAAEMRETLAGSEGPGGRGEKGIMAIDMAGYPDDLFVVPGQVMRAILQGDVEVGVITQTKREAKLAAAANRT